MTEDFVAGAVAQAKYTQARRLTLNDVGKVRRIIRVRSEVAQSVVMLRCDGAEVRQVTCGRF